MMRLKARLVVLPFLIGILFLATLLFADQANAAQAAGDQEAPSTSRPGMGVHGQITALTEDGFTLEGPRGVLNITVDDDTSFRIVGLADPSLADLAAGDQVLVRGQRQDDGFLAAHVARVPDGDRLGGRIETVAESDLTITGRAGETINVVVGPDTWLAFGGEDFTWAGDPAGRDMVEPGMRLVAFGTKDDDGLTIEADTLVVLRRPRPRTVVGEVTDVAAEAFTLMTRRGDELTILVGENSRFRLPGIPDAGLADLVVGDRLAVRGRPVGDGQMVAHLVAGRPGGPTFVGEILAIADAELSLETLSGRTITVLTSPDTRYLIPGNPNPVLEDFAVGDKVLVNGRWDEDGLLLAQVLAKRP